LTVVARAGFIALPVFLQGSLGFCIEAKNVLYARVPAGATPARWCEGEGLLRFAPRTMEKLSENIQCRLMFVW
jgi:hypothetical protein